MIRLLHTADLHLGKRFHSLGDKAIEFRNQLLTTFDKIVSLADSEKVSLLLISGDLFDSKNVFGITVGKVLSAFKRLEASGIRVCIIPGTHDAYGEDSPYRSLHFPKNVTLFTPRFRQQEFPDLDLTVYGLVPDSNEYGESPLRYLTPSKSSRFHVGMAHCSIRQPDFIEKDTLLLDKNELSNSGLDYLALGHWHSFQDIKAGDTTACYSGSPEPLAIDQKGAGKVVLVTIKDKNQLDLEPVHIATKRFESMTLDISPFASYPETITHMIEARADTNLILEASLTGLRSIKCEINCQELEELLKARFFYIRVLDTSHPRLDEIDYSSYSDKTVIWRFSRLMEEKIASARTPKEKTLYEEAFKLGFNLLLGKSQAIE